MNFLGHMYFSNDNVQLMYANIYGDFVKGRDLSHHSQLVQNGIKLHRRIDDYIDHHPVIIELTHHLYKDLPKVAGIAVDLYFDYLLAKNWKKYHTSDYMTFIQAFENAKIDRAIFQKEHFWNVMDRMKAGEWLKHSQSIYGLKKSSQGVSNLISFENVLHEAPGVFERNEARIEEAFHQFMKEAIPFFDNYIKENILLDA